jgi:hypothetical protein
VLLQQPLARKRFAIPNDAFGCSADTLLRVTGKDIVRTGKKKHICPRQDVARINDRSIPADYLDRNCRRNEVLLVIVVGTLRLIGFNAKNLFLMH